VCEISPKIYNVIEDFVKDFGPLYIDVDDEESDEEVSTEYKNVKIHVIKGALENEKVPILRTLLLYTLSNF
jgi:N12 class adenine-specific DNA methylase